MTQQIIRDLSELRSAIGRGFHPRYLFFWGHKPLPNGEIGAACLSQWWPAPFAINGNNYPTAEHFMMAEKARLFEDETVRSQILNATGPKEAKQLGRQVKNFKEEVWVRSRFDFVVTGNLAKFSQNRELAEFLLRTGEQVLVEASPLDKIWGIGMGSKNAGATDPDQWRGQNLLGFALMEVRQRLRDGKQ